MKKPFKTIQSLVPSFFALAIASVGLQVAAVTVLASMGEEVRQRLLEFKLMGVIEIEKRDKNKTIVEYHYLRNIKTYIKNFLRHNPKWKMEEEIYGSIKTGRIILTRVYRKYYKKREESEYCSECGHSLEDD